MRLLVAVRMDRGKNGDDKEIEAMLLQMLKQYGERLGDQHSETVEARRSLIQLYERTGRLEEAEELRAGLPQTG